MTPRRIVVVGGGISGLATALALTGQTSTDPAEIELLEATDRLGGALRSSPFAGLPAVDEGADAFLARVPDGVALAGEIGLADQLTSPTDAHPAVWLHGLHPIPEGLALGIPTGVIRLANSRLLTVRGKLRAALEPLLPRRGDPGDSIGRLVRARFGDEVHERLVDALIGSIYAADTDRFSLASVPQLAVLAEERSLLLTARRMRRRSPPPVGPVFLTPHSGMGSLAEVTAETARSRGVSIRRKAALNELAADGARWIVNGEPFDVVVLATPAASTAPLLTGVAPEAARLLATIDHAGVAIVTLAVTDWPERLRGRSGYLVPKPVQRTVTAASFGSQKWAHWRPPDGRTEILRVSLGRDGLPVEDLDDDELIARAVGEVGDHVGLDLQPTAVRVTRWPAAFPQYRPHHQQWLRRVEAALPTGVLVTGASYGGIGVPACIVQARHTAHRALDLT